MSTAQQRLGSCENRQQAARVLVVDDAHDTQRMLSAILRTAGVEVSLADNGLVGLQMAIDAWKSGRPFDLILMDMDMPVLDGWSATERLRAAGYQGLIIAFTANETAEVRIRCTQAGCDDFLSKTSGRDQFLTIVRHYLEKTGRNALI